VVGRLPGLVAAGGIVLRWLCLETAQ